MRWPNSSDASPAPDARAPTRRATRAIVVAGLAIVAVLRATAADAPDRTAAVEALRKGGLYIVMRHASSPRELPDAAHAAAGNVDRERQLDEAGRSSAAAMGQALRELGIPVGEVLTSPTWRARETAMLARWPSPKPVPELGDGGRGMQGAAESAAHWLRQAVTRAPAHGNTLVITHFPNVSAAFPAFASGLEDGEALILSPDAGGARLLARVPIDLWPRWASSR